MLKIEVFSVEGETLTAQSSFTAKVSETKFDKDVEATIGYSETVSARAKISVTTYKIVLYDFKREGSHSTHQEEI